jgi:hypothetical protein
MITAARRAFAPLLARHSRTQTQAARAAAAVAPRALPTDAAMSRAVRFSEFGPPEVRGWAAVVPRQRRFGHGVCGMMSCRMCILVWPRWDAHPKAHEAGAVATHDWASGAVQSRPRGAVLNHGARPLGALAPQGQPLPQHPQKGAAGAKTQDSSQRASARHPIQHAPRLSNCGRRRPRPRLHFRC